MLHDLRWAVRLALRHRALTAVIVLSLALGIGANTTIFTLINAVFLRPLPVPDPERLVQLFTVMPKSPAYQSLSLANYRDFRDFVPELSGLAAWRSAGVNMVGGAEPLAIGGQLVTGNYFELLGVEAARGHTFTPDEDKTPGDTRLVISDALWRRAFNGDAQYQGLGGGPQPHLYYPALQYHTPAMALAVRTSGDPESVLPMVGQVIKQLDASMPRPLYQTMTDVLRDNLWRARLGAALLAVFAILAVTLTCIGIYGVMAYSVTQRTREIGIRMALGAEHTRVQRMILRQTLKLTVLGVGLGLAAALSTTRLIANLLYVSPTDAWTFAAVGVLLGDVALLASYLPARRAARVDPLVALRYE